MSLTKKYTGTEPVRLNKWLAQSGVCSRREAEALIERGVVRVDGARVTEPGHKIQPGQTMVLDQKGKASLNRKTSVVIHKPVGYVSSQPEDGQIPAARLLTRENFAGEARSVPGRWKTLPPLGRLDMDSRGLLILSDDGVLAKALIGPQSALEKEYLVKVKGEITDKALGLLCHGLRLDDRALKPAKVTHEKGQILRFVLTEGRNRQIRRMAELVDLRVVDLLRIRIGPVKLHGLKEGEWRFLRRSERDSLQQSSVKRR